MQRIVSTINFRRSSAVCSMPLSHRDGSALLHSTASSPNYGVASPGADPGRPYTSRLPLRRCAAPSYALIAGVGLASSLPPPEINRRGRARGSTAFSLPPWVYPVGLMAATKVLHTELQLFFSCCMVADHVCAPTTAARDCAQSGPARRQAEEEEGPQSTLHPLCMVPLPLFLVSLLSTSSFQFRL